MHGITQEEGRQVGKEEQDQCKDQIHQCLRYTHYVRCVLQPWKEHCCRIPDEQTSSGSSSSNKPNVPYIEF